MSTNIADVNEPSRMLVNLLSVGGIRDGDSDEWWKLKVKNELFFIPLFCHFDLLHF